MPEFSDFVDKRQKADATAEAAKKAEAEALKKKNEINPEKSFSMSKIPDNVKDALSSIGGHTFPDVKKETKGIVARIQGVDFSIDGEEVSKKSDITLDFNVKNIKLVSDAQDKVIISLEDENGKHTVEFIKREPEKPEIDKQTQGILQNAFSSILENGTLNGQKITGVHLEFAGLNRGGFGLNSKEKVNKQIENGITIDPNINAISSVNAYFKIQDGSVYRAPTIAMHDLWSGKDINRSKEYIFQKIYEHMIKPMTKE